MADDRKTGDRIAKVMARAGVASRRNAERMIIDGRVTVNGIKITSPALDIRPSDRVTLDGKPIDAPQPARLWLYYKPLGLVTSENDEKGRQTVFDTMPDDMPRVMSVGRLDLNSEGLLLLTNDGALKRRLELPSTGWLRKYRVRVNGRPSEATFDPLRRGLAIDGEEFLPMDISLDKQQGANAWLTIGLREGGDEGAGAEASGVVVVDHHRPAVDLAEVVGREHHTAVGPVQQVGRRGVPPVQVAVHRPARVVLVAGVPHAVVEHEPVRVVHPPGGRRQVDRRTVHVGYRRRPRRVGAGAIDVGGSRQPLTAPASRPRTK